MYICAIMKYLTREIFKVDNVPRNVDKGMHRVYDIYSKANIKSFRGPIRIRREGRFRIFAKEKLYKKLIKLM